jgi:hypothetical protein
MLTMCGGNSDDRVRVVRVDRESSRPFHLGIVRVAVGHAHAAGGE